MTPQEVSLRLRRQRLQLRIAEQRREAIQMVDRLDGVVAGAGRVREGAAWVREHALGVSMLGAALLAFKPRFTLRWLRRGLVGWRLYREGRQRLEEWLPLR